MDSHRENRKELRNAISPQYKWNVCWDVNFHTLFLRFLTLIFHNVISINWSIFYKTCQKLEAKCEVSQWKWHCKYIRYKARWPAECREVRKGLSRNFSFCLLSVRWRFSFWWEAKVSSRYKKFMKNHQIWTGCRYI